MWSPESALASCVQFGNSVIAESIFGWAFFWAAASTKTKFASPSRARTHRMTEPGGWQGGCKACIQLHGTPIRVMSPRNSLWKVLLWGPTCLIPTHILFLYTSTDHAWGWGGAL